MNHKIKVENPREREVMRPFTIEASTMLAQALQRHLAGMGLTDMQSTALNEFYDDLSLKINMFLYGRCS